MEIESRTVTGLICESFAEIAPPTIRQSLPQVFIGGPFGGVSENVFISEVAVLVGAGTRVTTFASILKSIWYHFNSRYQARRLKKVYFFWICRDFTAYEWFKSLLLALEAQDLDGYIEIHTV